MGMPLLGCAIGMPIGKIGWPIGIIIGPLGIMPGAIPPIIPHCIICGEGSMLGIICGMMLDFGGVAFLSPPPLPSSMPPGLMELPPAVGVVELATLLLLLLLLLVLEPAPSWLLAPSMPPLMSPPPPPPDASTFSRFSLLPDRELEPPKEDAVDATVDDELCGGK